jgi:NAD(P)-dependent dehydrogenase (short-subunit alcohol dehydrogenase family)
LRTVPGAENREKVVVVSSSASGIGRAVVQRFAVAGWHWYGIDLEPAETVTQCGDVADDPTWERIRCEVEARFGRLDALVNNAGTNTRGSVEEVDLPTWQRILAVNLTSVYLSARHLLPLLRSSGGAIVNNASGAGLVGVRRGAAYAASKGGVIALTRQMAVDLAADGVRVNAVCPGVVDTPLVRKLAAGE